MCVTTISRLSQYIFPVRVISSHLDARAKGQESLARKRHSLPSPSVKSCLLLYRNPAATCQRRQVLSTFRSKRGTVKKRKWETEGAGETARYFRFCVLVQTNVFRLDHSLTRSRHSVQCVSAFPIARLTYVRVKGWRIACREYRTIAR